MVQFDIVCHQAILEDKLEHILLNVGQVRDWTLGAGQSL